MIPSIFLGCSRITLVVVQHFCCVVKVMYKLLLLIRPATEMSLSATSLGCRRKPSIHSADIQIDDRLPIVLNKLDEGKSCNMKLIYLSSVFRRIYKVHHVVCSPEHMIQSKTERL